MNIINRTSALFVMLLSVYMAAAQGRNGSQLDSSLLYPVQIRGDSLAMNIFDRMKFHHVSGVSIAVIDHGNVVWAKGYGTLEEAGKDPVDTLTLFQAASCSKPVAAFLALVLVDKGLLNLDENINTYLKTWKLPDNKFTETKKVTLRHILSHTAGLTRSFIGSYGVDEKPFTILDALEGKDDPQRPRPVRVDTIPGSLYRYSGGGFTVIQQMIEDVTGNSFSRVMQQYVLKPLGMNNSFFQMPLPETLWKNAATGYRRNGDSIPGKGLYLPELAGGGLWTTPSDYALFITEIQKAKPGGSKVLSKRLADEMLTPQMNNSSWGLGLDLQGLKETPYFQHGGVNIGFECWMIGSFETGQGAMVMANSNFGGQRLAREVIRGIAKVYHWSFGLPVVKDTISLGLESSKSFIGRYVAAPSDTFIVKIEGGRLFIQRPNSTFRELFAESTTRLFVRESEIIYQFKKDQLSGTLQLIESFPYEQDEVATKINK